MHHQKLLKSVVYRNQYIFGLPAEILGNHRRIQRSPGFPAPANSKPQALHIPNSASIPGYEIGGMGGVGARCWMWSSTGSNGEGDRTTNVF